jgi:protein-tyrosine-phosphatase
MNSPPFRLLFVCSANICRSPFAELLARQLFAGLGVEVSSAGVRGFDGYEMDVEMANQLRLRGGDSSQFASRPLTRADLDWADAVLTFEFRQHMKILDAHPDARGKVFGFGQFARAAELAGPGRPGEDLLRRIRAVVRPDSMSDDIADPFRRGAKPAAACAGEIENLLRRILPAISSSV